MRSTEDIASTIEAGEVVSVDEAHALVRSQVRTCRGKPVVPQEIQAAYFGKIAVGLTPQVLFDDYVSHIAGDADLGELGAGLGELGEKLHAFALARLVARGGNAGDALIDALRAHQEDVGQPCGADFNELVVAHPFDGQERPYTCSGCGVTGTFRSPLIPTRSIVFNGG